MTQPNLISSVEPNTIKIIASVIHKIEKERQGKAKVFPRSNCLEIKPDLEELIDRVHTLYGKQTGKSYGRFEDDLDKFPSRRYVEEYYLGKTKPFYETSLNLMNVLKGKIDDVRLATGGYILIAHIWNGAVDWLVIAMLTDTVGAAITENLDVVRSVHLELEHLRIAGRINLSAWKAGEERYISFLRGRHDLSDYFQHFLGCDNTVKSSTETKKLTGVLQSFAHDQGLDEARRDKFHQEAYDFCFEYASKSEPLSFEALANRIWPEAPEVLTAILADPELQLSDHFIPDKRSLRPLVKFRASTPLWKLEFDRKALRLGEVRFEPKDKTLILTKLPEDLRTRLEEEREDDG